MASVEPTVDQEGLKKLSLAQDEADETCATFVIEKEDHTLCNALRHVIMKRADAEFCGYSVPHPSEQKSHFRIQTNGTAAIDTLELGLRDLISICDHVKETFVSECERVDAEQGLD